MSRPLDSKMYEFLAETMRLAGDELEKRRGPGLAVNTKADTSLVTEADLASERVIIDRITRVFPDDLIYSEESGLSRSGRSENDHIWIIDPLDGTTNYANGYPFYCVSIGRGRILADGTIRIETGAILDAPRRRLYFAELGAGAFVDEKPLSVAPARDLQKCFLVTGFYYMKGYDLQKEIERFARVAQSCQSIRRDGAAALDLALVAEGVYDCFWEVGLQPWDVAAGSLLVAEAGGAVRNYAVVEGRPYDVEGTGVIAGSASAVGQVAALL